MGVNLKTSPLYRWYIFDLDGTLTDSSKAIGEGVITAMRHVGIDSITIDDVKRWIGRPLTEVFAGYIRERNAGITLDGALFEEMVRVYREGHDRFFPSGVLVYPGAMETLHRLRSGGAKLAVATTKFEAAAEFVVRGIGLREHVDVVCGTDPEHPVKPDPFVIRLALTRLGARPEETLVVGDTPADIIAGKAAGCHTAAAVYGFGDPESLCGTHPDHWLEHAGMVP